jgi:hypothetical protein
MGSLLTHSTTSGFGVDCRGWSLSCLIDEGDEIDYPEILKITFSSPTVVTGALLSNLFADEILWFDENGRYRINGGAWTPFTATSTTGFFNLAINPVLASTLEFDSVLDEFSVAAITTPEPGMLLLFGLGLVAGARRLRARG